MNELLFKFETIEEVWAFHHWFLEYGQYDYSEKTYNSITSVDSDWENSIINVS
jgi:hypothetical protein